MKRIAIVNDEQDFVDMVTLLLEDEGYEVRSCSDGSAALDLMHAWQPHLVLLDIRMQGLNGWQVLDVMQSQPELSGIRVLVTSGAIEEVGAERERLRQLGHDSIALPFDIDDFVRRIRALAG